MTLTGSYLLDKLLIVRVFVKSRFEHTELPVVDGWRSVRLCVAPSMYQKIHKHLASTRSGDMRRESLEAIRRGDASLTPRHPSRIKA